MSSIALGSNPFYTPDLPCNVYVLPLNDGPKIIIDAF